MRQKIGFLTASALIISVIAGFESFVSAPYMPTPNDVPTVGFGTTVNPDTGKPIRLSDPKVDRATATRWLVKDVSEFERGMRSCVKVPVTQGEWDAYASLTYNIGVGAFCKSTLVRKLNAGDYSGACEQIKKWDKQKGKVLRGLTKRRAAEYRLCIADHVADVGNVIDYKGMR